MNVLLDTCALIWLTSEPGKLSAPARNCINDARTVLHVSHATLWEISLKHATGKLTLPDAPRKWWTEQVARWALVEVSLSADTLLAGSELPLCHKDPFDRVIIAEALKARMSVVTADRAFGPYGVSIVW